MFAQFLVMLAMGCAVGGIVLTWVGYVIYRLVRRHVFKIEEPAKNFVVDKKVKCRSGKYLIAEEEDMGRSTPDY